MSRSLVSLALSLGIAIAVGCPSRADAQSGPIVLVLDGSAASLDPTLGDALEATLGRSILRPTDAGASDATATVSIAAARSHGWIVRFEDGGTPVTATTRGRSLAAVLALVDDVVRERASRCAGSTTSFSALVDPFVGPRPRPITVAFVGQLFDPFAETVTIVGDPEVVDPWR